MCSSERVSCRCAGGMRRCAECGVCGFGVQYACSVVCGTCCVGNVPGYILTGVRTYVGYVARRGQLLRWNKVINLRSQLQETHSALHH